MVRAVRIARVGGPEVLEFTDNDLPPPGPGEVRLRQTAIGLNYIDTYHRTGLYPVPLPTGLGLEAAGVVEAVGDGVEGFAPGDRAAYFMGPLGAYAEARNIAVTRLVKLPASVSDEVAAALLLKGCTAEFLAERCAKVEAGQTVLVQAAAGGVGLYLVQWLKALGVTVIGTAGSEAKLELARSAGADHLIGYSCEEVAPRVKELTQGRGVDVVFDGVGKATFAGSLDSLHRRGLYVGYGNASGPVGEVDFQLLARKGSLFATRPTLFDYYATPEDFAAGTARVLDMLASSKLNVRIDQRYALADAAQAHRDLEARATTGATVLVP